MSIKFGQIELARKDFNSVYQIMGEVDLDKIRLSEGIVANKNDARYIIGYQLESGNIIPLHIKTPKYCISPGVSQYNESSPLKMGFNVRVDNAWIEKYEAIWWRIHDLYSTKVRVELTGVPVRNDYINPKLITWDGEIKTRFYGNCGKNVKSCYATGVLKLGSIYKQGGNSHLQLFLKECKYKPRDDYFNSLLSDGEEGEGYDF